MDTRIHITCMLYEFQICTACTCASVPNSVPDAKETVSTG